MCWRTPPQSLQKTWLTVYRRLPVPKRQVPKRQVANTQHVLSGTQHSPQSTFGLEPPFSFVAVSQASGFTFCVSAMSNTAVLAHVLKAEKAIRREQQQDAVWKDILVKAQDLAGDLAQQFAAFMDEHALVRIKPALGAAHAQLQQRGATRAAAL
eukprot:4953097-Pyramimonas_sp.AAC.1